MTSEEENKRGGETRVSSVSISKLFYDYINDYNLSPTECFRRGIAVTLCDLGVKQYQSERNEERLKYVKEFLKRVDEDEKLKKQFEKIQLIDDLQKNIQNDFKKLKELMEEVKNE